MKLIALGSFSLLFALSACTSQPPQVIAPATLPGEPANDSTKRSMHQHEILDGIEYKAFKIDDGAGSTAYVVMAGLGTNGIKAPCPDIYNNAGNPINDPLDWELEDSSKRPLLKYGFAWVRVEPTPSAAATRADAQPGHRVGALIFSPWYIILTRSMSTGAVATQYAVLCYKKDGAPDDTLQRAYHVYHKIDVDAFSSGDHPSSTPSRSWDSDDHRVIEKGFTNGSRQLSAKISNDNNSNSSGQPCSNDGHKRFLHDAECFFLKVARHEWKTESSGWQPTTGDCP